MFDFASGAANDSGVIEELNGKRVLIAGSCGPLSYRVTTAFLRQGCRLVLHAPDAAVLQARAPSGQTEDMYALGDRARARGGDVRLLPCDFGDAGSVERFVKTAARVYGGLDVIVSLSDVHLTDDALTAADDDSEAMIADALRPAHEVAEATWSALVGRCYQAKMIHALSVCSDDVLSPSPKMMALDMLLRAGLENMTFDQNDRWFDHGLSVQALIAAYEVDAEACFRELADAACTIARGHAGWFDGRMLSMSAADVA